MNKKLASTILVLLIIPSIHNLYGSDQQLERNLYYAARSCKIKETAALVKKTPTKKALNRALWASLGSRYHTKSDRNCKAVAKFLLKKGADIEMLNRNRQTMVIAFSQLGRPWILNFVLKLGAKIDSTDSGGSQGIHKAAFWGMKDNIKILIKGGADVNARTRSRQTPLYNASIRGDEPQVETAKILLEHGADINLQAGNGFTPLMHAVMNANFTFARLLLNNNADINIASKKGYTVLSIARGCYNRYKYIKRKDQKTRERTAGYKKLIQVLESKKAKTGKRFSFGSGV